jgi:LysM repeat protein
LVAPTATPGLPTSYTLKKGEFPYCIARRFNVNPSELLRINNLTSTSVYTTGMVLKIPQTGNPFPGNRSLRPHPTTYTVKAGDTVYSIACLFGDVDPEAIAYVNGITSPNKQLSAGTTIDIP